MRLQTDLRVTFSSVRKWADRMSSENLCGLRVQYQVGIAEYGTGVVVAHDAMTDVVVILDEDDGSRWKGPAEKCEVLSQDCR